MIKFYPALHPPLRSQELLKFPPTTHITQGKHNHEPGLWRTLRGIASSFGNIIAEDILDDLRPLGCTRYLETLKWTILSILHYSCALFCILLFL